MIGISSHFQLCFQNEGPFWANEYENVQFCNRLKLLLVRKLLFEKSDPNQLEIWSQIFSEHSLFFIILNLYLC